MFLDKYDRDKLAEAKEIIIKVYEYNYPSKVSNRLFTIIKKIEDIERNQAEGGGKTALTEKERKQKDEKSKMHHR